MSARNICQLIELGGDALPKARRAGGGNTKYFRDYLYL